MTYFKITLFRTCYSTRQAIIRLLYRKVSIKRPDACLSFQLFERALVLKALTIKEIFMLTLSTLSSYNISDESHRVSHPKTYISSPNSKAYLEG